MSTSPKREVRRCVFCGDVVGENSYDYIGSARVWICGSAECDREARRADQEAHAEAQYEAERDGYERYL